MPFRDVVGHRRLVELLARSVGGATLPPSLIFAGPAGVGKRLTAVAARAGAQLPGPSHRSSAAAGRWPTMHCRSTPAGAVRPARASPAASIPTCSSSSRATAARSRSIRSATSSIARRIGRSKGGAASSSSTRPTRSSPAAQNALLKTLEEPPLVVGVHPRHRAAGRAAADGPLALPAAALPAARGRRYRGRAGRARTQRDAKRARSRRRPTAASARRSRRAPASWSRRATSRSACSRTRRRAHDPRRRLEGAKELLAKTGGGGASDREQLASHLRAMASLLRDVELLATRARRPRAGQPGRAARARAADAGVSGRARRARVSAPSIGRSSRSSAMPASRSSPTGWCCSYERRRSALPLVIVKLTPVGRAQTFLPDDLAGQVAPAVRRSRRRPDRRRHRGRHRRARASRSSRRKRRPPADSPQRVVRLATHDDIVARLKQQHREQEAYRIALLKIRERGLGDEADAGRAGVRRLAADLLLHGRRPRRFPRAGARAGRRVPHAHRDAADRRPRRGQDASAATAPAAGRSAARRSCTSFEPVSIKMAKQQDLSLNPSKLSGPLRPAEVLPALRAAERQGRGARRLRQRRRLRQPVRLRLAAAAARAAAAPAAAGMSRRSVDG